MIRTTSFGGTSPDVFRENVVRSETECMARCTVRLGRARGGRDDGKRWEGEVSGRAHPSRGNYVGDGDGYFIDYFEDSKWVYHDLLSTWLASIACCDADARPHSPHPSVVFPQLGLRYGHRGPVISRQNNGACSPAI